MRKKACIKKFSCGNQIIHLFTISLKKRFVILKMAHYGEVLVNYEPEKDLLYKYIAHYFEQPTMVKMKNLENYSIYMCKINCLLSNQNRYLIAFVNEDQFPLGTKKLLQSLSWKSFQTRTLPEKHDLPIHGYQPSLNTPLNKPIKFIKTDNTSFTYSCDYFSCTVTLLHGGDQNQYKKEGNILIALETYQTIITV
jgi:hypothetical protein